MRVFIVLEEDRGCGAYVVGVFASLEDARAFVDKQGSSYYIVSESGEEVRGYHECD